ncbi:MAG: adenylosuccinate lyase [Candidatus Peribacteraceae bacterium]|nr:adenylosuccinate lyase [Candidatus Peribacteraceae bacterium]
MDNALSPLDGRYAKAVEPLRAHFSEEALIQARLEVEIRYFVALSREQGVKELPPLSARDEATLFEIVTKFDGAEAKKVKEIEATTKHDVKAAEYYLKGKMAKMPGVRDHGEFVHFALTSEDVNNLSYGLLVHRALKQAVMPALTGIIRDLTHMARSSKAVPMLSLTHGQPATPTIVGKELMVFVERLERQLAQLKAFKMQGKLGGAVGNFSAHKAAYPDVNWEGFRNRFVKSLGLVPLQHTTQINPHDDIAELSHILHRIDTILLDLSRDAWLYISRGVFKQKVVAGEVGSSTMPHKVNPIDFENAEGNLGLANALFDHFAAKLPVSRLQRDLSDSTVQRNIGVAFGYHLLAVTSLRKGLGKLTLDRAVLKKELADHPEVVAEAVQTVLRKHGVEGAYEKLKALTRGEKVTREKFLDFIAKLPLPKEEIGRLQGLL